MRSEKIVLQKTRKTLKNSKTARKRRISKTATRIKTSKTHRKGGQANQVRQASQ